MTLEEAIKHCEVVASDYSDAKKIHTRNHRFEKSLKCEMSAEEHQQLAEWLKDYKRLLEQEPCADCISRQKVIDIVEDMHDLARSDVLSDTIKQLKDIPSVQPTRPIGRWIDIQYFKADDTYYRPKCSFCSIEPKEYSNYCPNCGARMEVRE